ncbi:HEXXH motif domain-containing protein [Umezawaea endophytica]|uniref:HEXXH motif domain-containing protein n=1 Tax=Umezawaea endophytica TaxID=1654476 RepID=A0A9X2VUW9_9PSEU|nr:HEXXH motif domain-containing protein [Umezawaea endophytica]MCS7483288.1 HEXXH motif domain-containing protein [Umezawaea endophytica]
MISNHGLSTDDIDALAADAGSASAVQHLVRANHSKHRTLLRAVLDHAEAVPGPLPPVGDAWELLAAAHRRNPDAVGRLLRYPSVGNWATSALRRLRGAPSDGTPSWVVVGHLHQIAVAAAVLADHPFTLAVPSANGEVLLPTVGLVRIPGEPTGWHTATATGDATGFSVVGASGAVRVDDRVVDGAGWSAVRRLRAGDLDVVLDDLYPFPGFGAALPPERLTGAEVARWRDALDDTWVLLEKHHGEVARALALGVTALVPCPPVDRFRTYSGSADDAFGCVALSLPSDAADFAATLVHEFQHSKLSTLLDLVELSRATEQRFYAPWRDDPRPLPGLLHGLYSFVAVVDFWRVQREADDTPIAHFEFAHWRDQSLLVARALRDDPHLTDLGRRFVSAQADRLEAWSTDPVPPDVLSAARDTAADHHATWRGRHLRPDPAHVVALADAWLSGGPRPDRPAPGSTLSAGADEPTPRPVLARLRLADPAAFAAVVADPGTVPGASGADLALVAGDTARALPGYLDLVRDDPTRTTAWTGLGAALRTTPAGAAILDRPDLVKAVYLAVVGRPGAVAPDPVGLAEWIGAAP